MIHACNPSDAELYCIGCFKHFDAHAAPEHWLGLECEWATAQLQLHEADCMAWRNARVQESLRFYAWLDAVRAPGSW